MSSDRLDTTRLLVRMGEGDAAAAEQLVPRLYDELHAIAAGYLKRERANHTLQPTALVHEAYIRLIGEGDVDSKNRAHFLAIAAKSMRQILVNHALARNAQKRGGGDAPAPLEIEPEDHGGSMNLLAVDQALGKLAALDPRKVQVVECRFFGGLTVEETAQALNISLSTVEADWRMARAWLSAELG